MSDYDYSEEGWYFVTIDTKSKGNILGRVVSDEMHQNDVGKLVDYWWQEIPKHFEGVSLDVYKIMPDHVHGVICINNSEIYRYRVVGDDRRVVPLTEECEAGRIPSGIPAGGHIGPPLRQNQLLFEIIKWFKTMSTNEYIRNVKEQNWTRFNGTFWQRSFNDRVIRNEKELQKLRFYAYYNPEGSSIDNH